MYSPLPAHAQPAAGVLLTPWTAVPEAPYCAMRYVQGTDPKVIANRVAFIEKTPRVRIQACQDVGEDWRNWHCGWKGEDGWDPVAQGWCDTHLLALGYEVPDAKPYDDSML